jgi:vitamin B12 transporter
VTDVNPFGTDLDGVTERTVSAFVQDNWRLHRRFRLLVGARWDNTDSWGSEVTGRLDIGWRFTETLELRGGFGQAFRAPAIGELYAPLGGNPDLQAERSDSGELGLVYSPRNGRSRWQLNLFATEIDNLIEYDYSAMQNRNIGSARIKGAELVWEQGVFDVVRWIMQGTWLDSEGEDDEPLLRRPVYSASWTLSGSFSDSWSGDATVRWVSPRDDVDPVTFERSENPGFTTFDLAVAWRPWTSLSITARAVNLLDADYEEVLGYPAAGRRFIAGLRWDF